MAEYTYEVATDIVLPNISVQKLYEDGVHISFELTTDPGYVMYMASIDQPDVDQTETEVATVDENEVVSPDENETEMAVPEENEDPVEPISYFRFCSIPADVPVESWAWVAVPESTVSVDQIF